MSANLSLESHSRSEGFLARHAGTGLLGARFLGWLPMVVPPLAGTTGMSYRRFLVFDAVGSLLYSSCDILLGIFVSAQLIQCMAVLRRFSVYGGAFANFVLRDVTPDGNTFEDSPSVDKKIFVPAPGVGATVGNRRFQVSCSYVFRGKEFDGQPDNERFASIAITYLI